MSRKKIVDAKDIQMLNILRTDGRIPSKELSLRIGLSEAATGVRLQNFFKRQIITDVIAKIDYSFVDLMFEVVVLFKVLPGEYETLITEVDRKHPFVLSWYIVRPSQIASASLQTVMALMVFKNEKHLLKLLYALGVKSHVIAGVEYYKISQERTGAFRIP